ncbi:hypothetical protein [Erythrobacter colymbi]|uniref:hypothetical protein n=1 Tax=Erythrobacter colymbi TaxID=1161202 RepID=UPI000A3B3EC2|nr:hypothetical protein [Erythrobacter colymbi]
MMQFLVLPLALTAAEPAAQADPYPAIPLPDTDEIAAYAADNWWDWGARVARFAGRTGESASLVRIASATCAYHSDHWPECDIVVIAKFGDGATVTQTLQATFERDDAGRLEEVIIMVHPRYSALPTDPVEVPPVN